MLFLVNLLQKGLLPNDAPAESGRFRRINLQAARQWVSEQ